MTKYGLSLEASVHLTAMYIGLRQIQIAHVYVIKSTTTRRKDRVAFMPLSIDEASTGLSRPQDLGPRKGLLPDGEWQPPLQ